jgi:hypothetical protein
MSPQRLMPFPEVAIENSRIIGLVYVLMELEVSGVPGPRFS